VIGVGRLVCLCGVSVLWWEASLDNEYFQIISHFDCIFGMTYPAFCLFVS